MIAFGGGVLVGAVALVLVPEGVLWVPGPLAVTALLLAGGGAFMLLDRRQALTGRRAQNLPEGCNAWRCWTGLRRDRLVSGRSITRAYSGRYRSCGWRHPVSHLPGHRAAVAAGMPGPSPMGIHPVRKEAKCVQGGSEGPTHIALFDTPMGSRPARPTPRRRRWRVSQVQRECSATARHRVSHRPPTGALVHWGTAPVDGPWKTLSAPGGSVTGPGAALGPTRRRERRPSQTPWDALKYQELAGHHTSAPAADTP